jgi:hypothetical protein
LKNKVINLPTDRSIPGESCRRLLGGRKAVRSGVLCHAHTRTVAHTRTMSRRENAVLLNIENPAFILSSYMQFGLVQRKNLTIITDQRSKLQVLGGNLDNLSSRPNSTHYKK